tara:strand:+ start:15892 stop:17364 length:1473 start_codon:yes stop_codon:yes gene_type:complete
MGQVFDEDLRIIAPDGVPFEKFGQSVAAWGPVVFVGANTDGTGSVYAFDSMIGHHMFQIKSSDIAQGDSFGCSVSASGSTLIVGAYGDDDAGSRSGSAYLFDATTGDQTFKLTPSNAAAQDRFGHSVAVADSVAVVGAYLNDDAGMDTGSAYLFDTKTGNQLFVLTAPDLLPSSSFGYSVGISGNIAVVGAPSASSGGIVAGAAYVFDVLTGEMMFKLIASDAGQYDQFGRSVSVSGDIAVVGAPASGVSGTNWGSAYVFDVRTGQQLHKLVPSDATEDGYFGYSTSVSGATAVVGARFAGDAGPNSGAAYLFDVQSGKQIARLRASDGQGGDELGVSVSIDGSVVVVGADRADVAGASSGAAFIFHGTPGILEQPTGFVATSGQEAVFSVLPKWSNGVSYQWRRNAVALDNSDNITGASSPTLRIIASEQDEAYYDCVLTKFGSGSITNRVVLAVTPDPDACFVDVNGDGAVNFFDIQLFISFFGVGCP